MLNGRTKQLKVGIMTYTAKQISDFVGGFLRGENVDVTGVCTVDAPKKNCIGFLKSETNVPNDIEKLESSIWIVPKKFKTTVKSPLVAVDRPRFAFLQVMSLMYKRSFVPGISKTAIISDDAKISEEAKIGEYCVIGPNCEIGPFTELRNHVVLHENVTIGSHCTIKSHAVIGEEGYGFEKDDEGVNQRIIHIGGVRIHDYVEVGAGASICSGTIDPTRVGNHTKIDDLVFIAHNCQIGENCNIIACSEVSGSVKIGDGSWVAPNATILNGVEIGEDVLIGLAAAVTKDCPSKGVYAGVPAKKIRDL